MSIELHPWCLRATLLQVNIVAMATLERFPTVDTEVFIGVDISLLDTFLIVTFELLDILVLFARGTSDTGFL